MTINMGPQHPSTHGVLRLELEVDGEMVLQCIPHIGYLHTAIEKTAEKETYHKAIVLFDRMDYLSPLTNNMAYIGAVEQLCGIQASERATIARVLLMELSRINSHLVWLGTSAIDLGATTPFLWSMIQREQILDIFELASGVRMMTSYIQEGGLAKELPLGFDDVVRNFLNGFPKAYKELRALLERNPIWLGRTEGIGVITRQDVLDYGLTGPIARASGVPTDLRKTNPYLGYETYDFDVPVREEGDVYARFWCRLMELGESHRICVQALERLKTATGEYRISHPLFTAPPKERIHESMEALIRHFKFFSNGYGPPKGDVYYALESPKGEIGFYVVSDGTERPRRVKVRPPSFVNLKVIEKIAPGHLISDVVAIIGSLDIVLGEIDR
ncbi:MAG TPA: NADH dehydrogenase (quinone) subunit D [bacterium]|nr:NADH dehydrogenase (quinone) subunit D [bacterium]